MTTDFQGLGKVCAACGTTRKSKNLLYDPQTLLGYCSNPYICNEKHPNSPVNLIRNKQETLLVDYDTAAEAHKAQLINNFDRRDVDRIVAITTKPYTLRIQDPDMAKFLVELQESRGFGNIAETIRYCIETMKVNQGVYYSDHKQARIEREIEETAQAAVDTFAKPNPTAHLPEEPASDDEELSF